MSAICAIAAAAGAALGGLGAAFFGARRLARERARLASLVRSLPDGVVVTDLRGDVLACNDCARDILGSQEGPDLRMRVQEILKRRTQGELMDVTMPGGRGRFLTTVKLFSGSEGEDLGVLVVMRAQPEKS